MRGPGRFVFFDSRPERKPGACRPVTRRGARGAGCRLRLWCGLALAGLLLCAASAQAGPATGKPAISGAPQVNEILTADTGNIMDTDGLGTFSYQWIRVGGHTNTSIPGATSRTYTPVTADVGKKIKARVSFTDGTGNAETVTSNAYPSRAYPWDDADIVAAKSSCPTDSDWCAELTVGYGNYSWYWFYYGYRPRRQESGYWGELSNATIVYGDATYTIQNIHLASRHSGDAFIMMAFVDGVSVPDGTIFNLGGYPFTLDENSSDPDEHGRERYFFGYPSGFNLVEGQKIMVSAKFPDDTNATGQPSIAGTPQVGETLTANTGDTMDSDGLGVFSYQWIRVDGLTETNIAGATSNTYAPVTADVGKRIKVKVSFTDGDGTQESVTSDAYPSRGYPSSVIGIAAAKTACPADNDWCAELTVGYGEHGDPTVEFYYGFTPLNVYRSDGGGGFTGTLSNRALSYGFTNLTFQRLGITDKRNIFVYAGFANSEGVPEGTVFNYGGITFIADSDNFYYDTFGIGQYVFNHRSGLSMVEGQKMTVSVTFPDSTSSATGQPAITGTPQVGQTLSVSTADIVDADGKTKAENDDVGYAYTYQWLRVDEGTETEISNATTDSYTLRADDEGATVKVRVSFTDDRDNPEGPLESAATATVTEPAAAGLTAEFVDVPEEHSGDSYATYTVKLLFSEDVKVANKRMRKRILKLQNAVLEEARRIDRRKDYWEFRVRPASHRAITLSLASAEECGARDVICTFDGRPLSEPVTETIIGPPGMSVADAEVEEGPDAVLEFAVTLDRAPRRQVTVNYETEDGTAVAGEDYVRTNGMLVFAAGETEKTVSVEVLDDAHNEGSETMTLRLGGPVGAWLADGEAVGTIRNTDHMPQAWLARFGRTVADQVIEAVEGRMTAARSPGTEVTVAGQRIGAGAVTEADREEQDLSALTDWLRGREDERPDEARALPGGALLAGTSFALTEGSRESGLGSVWGRAAHSRFDGREGVLTLDGEVESALLGADLARGRGTAGLVLSRSRGEGGYRSPQGSGEVEATLMGLYPWGSYAASERLVLWGVLGHGEGTLTLRPAGLGAIETDMDLSMAAAGLRGLLAAAPAEGGLELSTVSDMLLVRTTSEEIRENGQSLASTDAEVTRVRVGLEGAWRGLGSLEPSFGIGMRHDGGDAETGLGADIGAGLAWTDPGLGLEAEFRARGLLTHEASGFRERGFAGSLAWDPEPLSDRGPRLTLSQTVGGPAAGGVEALLRPETARVLEAANEDGSGSGAGNSGQSRLEARFGYGWPSFGGRYVVVPEVGLGVSETAREYIHGWRLVEAKRGGLAFGLDVEAARREPMTGNAAPEHRLGFGLGWRREDAAFEFRLEGSRLQPVSGNRAPEHRIGLTLTARW